MEIKNGELITRVYDKMEGFNFETIKMLNLSSHVHTCILRNIFVNAINRTEKLSSNIEEMIRVIQKFMQ